MNAVEKALWYIESHYSQQVTLDDLVRVAGVSRYHLSRVFGYSLGMPMNRYLRERRLSLAASALADGQRDILDLALSLGYGSHEAFSRAFKQRFGSTPEQVRAQRHTHNLQLLEAVRMNTQTTASLQEPRIVQGAALLLAGLSRKYAQGDNAAIPGQWQAFGPRLGNIAGQIGGTAYGVAYNIDDDDNYEYLCAVEVSGFDRVPDDLARLRLAEQTYAVFRHDAHVSAVQATCGAIFGDWLPQSGRTAADAPFFERYPDTFDAQTGYGGLEVWLPINA